VSPIVIRFRLQRGPNGDQGPGYAPRDVTTTNVYCLSRYGLQHSVYERRPQGPLRLLPESRAGTGGRDNPTVPVAAPVPRAWCDPHIPPCMWAWVGRLLGTRVAALMEGSVAFCPEERPYDVDAYVPAKSLQARSKLVWIPVDLDYFERRPILH
jgi:hypothetical protein